MATPAEIVAAIDTAVLDLQTGAEETQVLGRRVRRASLGSLLKTRRYYASLADDATDESGGTALISFEGP
jgi:hypothetical protein